MPQFFKICILILAVLSWGTAHTQVDTTKVEHLPVSKLTVKPRLGIGLGTLTYYGDVGRDQANYGIGNSDFAGKLSLSCPINSFLDLSLSGTFGTIYVRETGSIDRLNFKSQISMYTAELGYNFQHFIPLNSSLQPFISTGFSSIEFLTKTDMFDAQGRMYHYWSDGTIRDLPQTSFNSSQSTIIHTDYDYETDVRELQEGTFGSYPERTWAIPITVGAKLRLSERFHSQFAASYYLTFSDLIDNVGQDQGRKTGKNDKLLYLGASLSYDLSVTPMVDEEFFPIEGERGTEYANIDWDGDKDGVHDLVDECLGTPVGVPVDDKGCPLDGDKDGVPNFRDDELDSPEGEPVSNNGIAITDEQFYKNYLFWKDEIPYSEWNRDYRSIFSDQPGGRIFTVEVASERDQLSPDQINALLSAADMRILDQEGEKIYVVGEFNNLADAIERKIELEQDGLSAELKEEVRNADTGTSSLNQPDASSKAVKAIEEELRARIDDESLVHLYKKPAVYRVQIGAYKNSISDGFFEGVPNLTVLKGNDGLTRYSSGAYTTIEEAAAHKIEMLILGYTDSFITSYRGGDRVTLKSTGVNLVDGADDPIVDQAFNGIDISKIQFSLKLGTFSGDIPTATLDKYLKLGNVQPIINADGSSDYMLGSDGTFEDATRQRDKAKSVGVKGTKMTATFNGNPISVEDAKQLLQLK